MNPEEKVNKIIELLQSPDLDDYECCIEIAKVVGVYNYEQGKINESIRKI